MSNETWRVVVDASVRKALDNIPLADAEAITVALAGLATNPYAGDIQKLKGEEAWRRRVRSYRVEFRIYQDMRTVLVYELKRRTSTTCR
ncbi:MAG: hypothetical protein Q7S08_01780 [bacterium]|nr:hypothetical protein [bacterium]